MEQEVILFQSAVNKCKAGQFEEGIHLYSQYLKRNPHDAKAYYQRGKAYFKLKNYGSATSDLNKALSYSPEDAHLISERALVYFMANKTDKAMKDFDKAVELEPENPFRWSSRAFIKNKLNDLNGAIEDYQKAIELDPEDAIAYNNLGMVLEKMGRNAKAEKFYEKAADLDPKNYGMGERDKQQEPPKNQNFNKTVTPSEDSNSSNPNKLKLIGKTLKKLSNSKEERKAFWSFIKEKLT